MDLGGIVSDCVCRGNYALKNLGPMFNKDTYANFQMAIMYLRIMKDLLNRRRNRKSLEFAALSAGRYLNQLDMIMKGDKLYEIAKREVI